MWEQKVPWLCQHNRATVGLCTPWADLVWSLSSNWHLWPGTAAHCSSLILILGAKDTFVDEEGVMNCTEDRSVYS